MGQGNLFTKYFSEISSDNAWSSFLLSVMNIVLVWRVNGGGGDGGRFHLNNWNRNDHYGCYMSDFSLA